VYSLKYPQLAEALYHALLPDPFYVAMENSVRGNLIAKKEAMLRYMDQWLKLNILVNSSFLVSKLFPELKTFKHKRWIAL
jgi:hypothetical protein